MATPSGRQPKFRPREFVSAVNPPGWTARGRIVQCAAFRPAPDSQRISAPDLLGDLTARSYSEPKNLPGEHCVQHATVQFHTDACRYANLRAHGPPSALDVRDPDLLREARYSPLSGVLRGIGLMLPVTLGPIQSRPSSFNLE